MQGVSERCYWQPQSVSALYMVVFYAMMHHWTDDNTAAIKALVANYETSDLVSPGHFIFRMNGRRHGGTPITSQDLERMWTLVWLHKDCHRDPHLTKVARTGYSLVILFNWMRGRMKGLTKDELEERQEHAAVIKKLQAWNSQ